MVGVPPSVTDLVFFSAKNAEVPNIVALPLNSGLEDLGGKDLMKPEPYVLGASGTELQYTHQEDGAGETHLSLQSSDNVLPGFHDSVQLP